MKNATPTRVLTNPGAVEGYILTVVSHAMQKPRGSSPLQLEQLAWVGFVTDVKGAGVGIIIR